MRLAIGMAFLAAFGPAGCKNAGTTTVVAAGSSTAVGSAVGSAGSAAAPRRSAVVPGSAGTATAPAASLSPTALDDALTTKGIEHDDVVKRADQPHSQWAIVKSKGSIEPISYTIWRTTAAGTSTLELLPILPRGETAFFTGVTTIDVRDLDNDGIDDAVITASWERDLEHAVSKRHTMSTAERVEQVYVVGGAALSLGAQHVRSYTTESNLGPDENAQPAESITFTTSVEPGHPPMLHAAITDSTIWPKRMKGLLDPAKDPLLVPADVPVTFNNR